MTESKKDRAPRESIKLPVIKRTEADVWSREELFDHYRIIQHDTRNLISQLDGKIAWLKMTVEKGNPSPEKLIDDLEKLEQIVKRVHHSILGKNIDEIHKLRIEEVNLLDMFRDTIGQLQSSLQVILDPSLDCSIEADRFLLEDVITNLVLNASEAVKKTDKKSGMLYAQAIRRELTTEILVIDDGPGIPTHIREKLFEPRTTSKDDYARGFGLFGSLIKVRLHNGSLSLISSTTAEEIINKDHNTGTTFMITLPNKQIVEIEEEQKLA